MFLRHLVRRTSIDIQVKFYGDRPRGTPPSEELNTRGVADEYRDYGPIERYISETVQDRSKISINQSLIGSRLRQPVAWPNTRPKVETSTRPAPLQVDRPDPKGQQRHSTCRCLETCCQTRPRSVATAQAGFAMNDDDDGWGVGHFSPNFARKGSSPSTTVGVRKLEWTSFHLWW